MYQINNNLIQVDVLLSIAFLYIPRGSGQERLTNEQSLQPV